MIVSFANTTQVGVKLVLTSKIVLTDYQSMNFYSI